MHLDFWGPLSRAAVNRKLFGYVPAKQLQFIGHIIRKDSIENLALPGKIDGKRSRGRRRVLRMSSLTKWLEERGVNYQEVELLERARNRELWHNMIASSV